MRTLNYTPQVRYHIAQSEEDSSEIFEVCDGVFRYLAKMRFVYFYELTTLYSSHLRLSPVLRNRRKISGIVQFVVCWNTMHISKVVDDEGQTQTTIFFIKFLTAYLVPFLKLFKITFFLSEWFAFGAL